MNHKHADKPHGHHGASAGTHAKHDTPGAPGLTTDPVCGMAVDPATSTQHVAHEGTTYRFCSAECRTKFAADPEAYLRPKAAPPRPAPPGIIFAKSLRSLSGSLAAAPTHRSISDRT